MNTDQIKSSAALFEHFSMPEQILNALTKNNFINPTPVQQEVLPVALKGLDVLGSAQTGTGKTLAFAIPLLAKLLLNEQDCALVVVPTRELATQVLQALQTLIGRDLRIGTALLIGGEPIFKQFRQLRAHPRIVVGTPGRIIDHLEQGTYNPKNVSFLVLDEMDRMFDMGFDMQVAEIIRHLTPHRQTLMFSATLPREVEVRAQKYLKEPVRIAVGPASMPAANITQEIIHVIESAKYDTLLTQLNQREGSVIIFVKTKMGAAHLADRLNEENHGALAMHGDLRQRRREQVVLAFRKGRQRILVATDIAARGLDIPHIQHVINYDLPQCPEDYVHRIGRTARAGASGAAVCLIAPHERRLWSAIDRLLNPGKPVTSHADEGSSFNRRRSYNNGRSSSSRDFGKSRSGSNDRFGDRRSSSGFGRRRDSNDFSSSRSSSDFKKPSFSGNSEDGIQKQGFFAERSSADTFKKRSSDFPRRDSGFKKPYRDGQKERENNYSSSSSSFTRPRGNRSGSGARISFFDQADTGSASKDRSSTAFKKRESGDCF